MQWKSWGNVRRALEDADFLILKNPGKYDLPHFKGDDPRNKTKSTRVCNFKHFYHVEKEKGL